MEDVICKTELDEHIRKDILKLHQVCSTFDQTEGQVYLSTELNYDSGILPDVREESINSFPDTLHAGKGGGGDNSIYAPEVPEKGMFSRSL